MTLSIILVYKIDLVDSQSTRVDIIQIDAIYQGTISNNLDDIPLLLFILK